MTKASVTRGGFEVIHIQQRHSISTLLLPSRYKTQADSILLLPDVTPRDRQTDRQTESREYSDKQK